ncbi:MAG TPA: JDVT-CTERM system glutamic-type intramembrane protease [Candidatus Entotheonella sp.]
MGDITEALGLKAAGPFYRDWRFLTALLAGIGFWLGLWWWIPVKPIALWQIATWRFVALSVWYPCAEELIFRGFVQGQLHHLSCGRRTWAGISAANLITSVVFVLGHFWQHPAAWAVAVAVPSLVFGWFRDRHGSVYPCIVLHMFYNAGYFALTGLP